jgi:hypothetical protein
VPAKRQSPQKFLLSIGVGVLVLSTLAVFSLVAAIPTYFLWNWLMPTIFSVKVITFWQAWGINFLTGILFKSKSDK